MAERYDRATGNRRRNDYRETGVRQYGRGDAERRYRETGAGRYNRREMGGGIYGSQEGYKDMSRRAVGGNRGQGGRRNPAEGRRNPAEGRRNPAEGRRNPAEGRRNPAGARMRQKRRRERMVRRVCALAVELVLCLAIVVAMRSAWKSSNPSENASLWNGVAAGNEDAMADAHTGAADFRVNDLYPDLDLEGYPEDMIKLLELNQEAMDYIKDYPNRAQYQNQPIDLSGDVRGGEVPLLMQWDRRWGYDAYGDDMIGLSGCGPVCLDMAYLYFTGDTGMTPRDMAVFAYDNGYYAEGGTSWSLWTEGAAQLGLSGEELPLDESRMKQALDGGGLIVCSMRPGDFTTTGHFILIRGYDENGFYVNDPNRRSNSEKQWDYGTLRYQIKNLWALRK